MKGKKLTADSQVSLSIELRGRIKTPGHFLSLKEQEKEEKKKKYIEKAGKKYFPKFIDPTYHTASQSMFISDVSYLISLDGKPAKISPSNWKKMNNTQRLEAQLQITADYLSGVENTKFSYEIMN